MNSPETPGTLGPAMDPGLRELYGTTYKDLSHAAAARRAADAMAAKLPASRGPPADRAAALARANPPLRPRDPGRVRRIRPVSRRHRPAPG